MRPRNRRVIRTDLLRENMRKIRSIVPESAKVLAVVKADGYGHGAAETARAALEGGAEYLAVASVAEGTMLRHCGITAPILVLGAVTAADVSEGVENGLIQTVCSPDMVKLCENAAAAAGKETEVHIKIDTGMGRIGIRPDSEGRQFVKKALQMPGLIVEGMFTHFAKADEKDPVPTYRQIGIFTEFRNYIRDELGYEIPLCHCSNSAGIIEFPEANMDIVRAGITLYGLWPSDEVSKTTVPLIPVMSLYSHIVYIKEAGPGVSVSYGGTFVTSNEKTRIATIPAGYGDGYPRSLSNKGYVLICGKRAPILGRVCMDQMMADVTDIPQAREGSLCTLIGTDGDETITMEQLGDLSGRFNYELACNINERVPRIVCGGSR